ncbi:hypothetical protein [uncultured Psychroserpens sp.]|uniref:hypothetical protein n=1 Tax=uncultured Psychroserpens sp. TaxID=255436 RepID=UPI002608216F|nr:hypothetical protein [uncultured Psychroserpens sp.]
MKSIITLSILFLAVWTTNAQNSSIKKELDSLKTVHAVCMIEDNIKTSNGALNQLMQEKQKLLNQLSDIQSFKIGRTKLEKEKQMKEITNLIKTNNTKLNEATQTHNALIEELKVAKEKVRDL